jgi:hypothetical protein
MKILLGMMGKSRLLKIKNLYRVIIRGKMGLQHSSFDDTETKQ